jgi:DNA-binding beta-propeller fold protein YncE
VDVYSRLGTRIGQWTIAPAYGNRKAPNLTALAWHGTTLYVLDGRYNRILSIDSTVPASEPAALAIPAGSLLGPEGMAVAPDGTIWVADTDHERVVAFSPAGTVKQVVKLHDGVWGVAVLPSGEVAATRYYSGAVVLITPGSAAVKNLGFTHGAGPRELWHPTTVIALPSGGLAIWDRGNARAVMTTSAGVPVAWLNEPAGASAFTVLLAGAVAWTTPKGLQPISP